MTQAYSPPQHNETRFNCPMCGAFSGHHWRELIYQSGVDKYDQNTYAFIRDERAYSTWSASLCAACNHHSLWIGKRLVHPANRNGAEVPKPANNMPPNVEELYLEASAVLPHSRRAAAALCRASLERLAKHLTPDSPPKSSLDERLIVLSGKTTAGLSKGLQLIRHAGNTALHGARDDDKSTVIYMDGDESDLISLFFATINELIDELITRPERINAAYELIPLEKRKAIERKMAGVGEGP